MTDQRRSRYSLGTAAFTDIERSAAHFITNCWNQKVAVDFTTTAFEDRSRQLDSLINPRSFASKIQNPLYFTNGADIIDLPKTTPVERLNVEKGPLIQVWSSASGEIWQYDLWEEDSRGKVKYRLMEGFFPNEAYARVNYDKDRPTSFYERDEHSWKMRREDKRSVILFQGIMNLLMSSVVLFWLTFIMINVSLIFTPLFLLLITAVFPIALAIYSKSRSHHLYWFSQLERERYFKPVYISVLSHGILFLFGRWLKRDRLG